MRLGYKILVPQLLLLALLVATSGVLFFDLKGQETGLRTSRQHLEEAMRIAGHLVDHHNQIAVAVLSYRLDRSADRVGAIKLADGQADKSLAVHAGSIGDATERALFSAVVESRRRIRDSRDGFLVAFDTGDASKVEAAFARWQIHRRLLEANLDDFSAFNLDRFARASEQIAEEREAFVRFLLYGVAAAIVVTMAAFLYVRGAVSRPLASLTDGISAFGGGRLGARIDPRLQDSQDEIGLVAKSFNSMAEDIESLNRGLERRVAERTAQLEAANRELEAFAYSVSHDLRAPLRSIDGFSQALLEDYGAALDDEGRDNLRRVRDASQHMAELIDDMLKLSRATRSELDVGPVDLSALAQSCAAELRRLDSGRDVALSIAPDVTGRGDARLLGVVLENLLSNAWKFTARTAAACIEFGAEKKDGELVCHVRDNGAGFDMAYIDNLFAPFQRLHRASEFPGNGIGLATVKRVIARLGGRVWAEGAVGAGATFYFALPETST